MAKAPEHRKDNADKIRAARESAGLTQDQVAEKIGISQRFYAKIESGETPGLKYQGSIRAALGLADVAPRALEGPSIHVDGMVSAGPGDINQYEELHAILRFHKDWRAVKVNGDSAYPVVFSGQYALIDESRAVRMADFDERQGWDLDDDVVLVRLIDGRAMLKRFCYHPPYSFVLASVNGGRRSPMVNPDRIDHIAPVVGVVYHDPQLSRANRWKEKRKARAET